MATTVETDVRSENSPAEKRSRWSWALYEGGRIPYMALITSSVFVPYFATTVVDDPVQGQALIANLGKIAGICAAVTAPILGASVDRLGPRKPLIGVGTAVMVVLLFSLWWAKPGDGSLPVWTVIGALVMIKVFFGYTEVLHNSMLSNIAPPRLIPTLSAGSLVIGSAFSVTTLVFVLWAFAMPGKVDWSFVPSQPLFGLNAAEYENVRIAGPLAAVLMAVMTIPILMFTRDYPKTKVRVVEAVTDSVKYLASLPKHLKGHRDATIYLFSRMIYADGGAALALLGGVYAAGVMKWGATELLVLGILRMIAGMAGATFSGILDTKLGSKPAVIIELILMMLLVTAMLGMSTDTVLFFWTVAVPADPTSIFSTLPEQIFLGIMVGLAFCSLALSSSSRCLLTNLTPASEAGAFFGLYALATSATAWLAPWVIEIFTNGFNSQQAGFAPILGFFAIGLIGLLFVRVPRTA